MSKDTSQQLRITLPQLDHQTDRDVLFENHTLLSLDQGTNEEDQLGIDPHPLQDNF